MRNGGSLEEDLELEMAVLIGRTREFLSQQMHLRWGKQQYWGQNLLRDVGVSEEDFKSSTVYF